jgi:hypothetical protein
MAEIEDRDYFVHGPNIFNRSDYEFLLTQLQVPEDQKKKRLQWPSKIEPFWIDQLKTGWTQWCIGLNRTREVTRKEQPPRLNLFYNSSTPYAFYFTRDIIIVWCLAKSEEHALAHANKICTQQYLHKGWLEAMNGQPYRSNIW